MNFRTLGLAILLPVFTTVTASSLQAQTTAVTQTIEESAEQRINLAGMLRMLSQRMPSAACHLSRGIDTDSAREILVSAADEFEQILHGLEFGDADLNIRAAETRRKTLFAISEVRKVWTPLKSASEAVLADPDAQDDLAFLLANNLSVLQASQLLVEELVKQYANPNAATKASLMLIDIAGRQRMLTQKISKESCMIGGAFETETTLSDLAGTISIFEASLEALRFGMPAVGIAPPPNATISDGLNVVLADWNIVRPFVTGALAESELEAADKSQKFQALNMTMANMNKVVGMYTEAIKN